MKTTKRGKCLIALCAAAVLVLACLPVALLRAGDQELFGRAGAVEQPYTSRQTDLEDFLLLRQLRDRTKGWETETYGNLNLTRNDQGVYAGSSSWGRNNEAGSSLTRSVINLLGEMNASGVLPDEWYHIAVDDIALYDSRTYYTTDSLGLITVNRYPHAAYSYADDNYYELPEMSLVMDPQTEKLLSLYIVGPEPSEQSGDGEAAAQDQPVLTGEDTQAAAEPPLDPPEAARRWVTWEGLDDLGDWADPVGTGYEGQGLYSARGQTLITCSSAVAGNWDAYRGRPYYRMDLTWMPCFEMPENLAADNTIGALPDTLPACDGDGEGCYYIENRFDPNSDGVVNQAYSVLMRVDYATATAAPYCTVPGCTHSDPDCPAWMPQNWTEVCVIDGRVLVAVSGSNQSSLTVPMVDAMDGEEIIGRYLAEQSGVPYELYSEALPEYTELDVKLARLWFLAMTRGSRVLTTDGQTVTTVAEFPQNEMYDQLFTDGTCLYTHLSGRREDWNRWVQINPADGSCQSCRIPETCAIYGSYGGQLILRPQRDINTMNRTDAPQEGVWFTIELYDPVTGQSRELLRYPRDRAIEGAYSAVTRADDQLLMEYRGPDGNNGYVMMNLDSGKKQDVTQSLLGLTMEDYASWWMTKIGGTWVQFCGWNTAGTVAKDNRLVDLATGQIIDLTAPAGIAPIRVESLAPDGQMLINFYKNNNYVRAVAPVEDVTRYTEVELLD